MKKWCNKCKTEKEVSEFYIDNYHKRFNPQHVSYYSGYCKVCSKAKQIAYRKKNPAKGKDIDLFQSFGIRFEDYKNIYDLQNGCCAICLRHSSEFKRQLSVDHCHETGKIRGLLCIACNTSLGKFNDDIETLKRCISYLEKNKSTLDEKSNVFEFQLRKEG